jgi:hypothetical protein
MRLAVMRLAVMRQQEQGQVILADLQVKDQAEEQQVEEGAKDKNSLLHHSSFFDNLYSTPANTQIIFTGYVSTILSDYL